MGITVILKILKMFGNFAVWGNISIMRAFERRVFRNLYLFLLAAIFLKIDMRNVPVPIYYAYSYFHFLVIYLFS